MALTVGEKLQERYQVVRNIKSGGMGSVYEAVDHKLASTPCAIKEVLASALEGRDAAYVLQSFESEMKALASLEHPNIPRVRDYFEIEGRRYIVLDLVHGQTLEEELAHHLHLTQSPMDPAVAAVDMVQVLETLAYLHDRQPAVIHRDIKSANLIRDSRTNRIKVVDFGIARSVETQSVQTQVGTPGFCAPEQMAGRAECRSDLYSVGATLYHLCTGRLPPAFTFEALDLELPDYPGLVKIVLKATQLKPQDRYASADEMAGALKTWLRNEGSSKIDPTQIPVGPRPENTRINPLATTPMPPNQSATWALVLVMLVAAGGLLLSDYKKRFGSQPAPPARPVSRKVNSHPSPAPKPEPKPKPSVPSVAYKAPAPEQPKRQPPKPSPRPLPKPERPASLGTFPSYPTGHVGHRPPTERPTSPEPPTSPGLPLTEDHGNRRVYEGEIDGYQVRVGRQPAPGNLAIAARAAAARLGSVTFVTQNPLEWCGYINHPDHQRILWVRPGVCSLVTIRPCPAPGVDPRGWSSLSNLVRQPF